VGVLYFRNSTAYRFKLISGVLATLGWLFIVFTLTNYSFFSADLRNSLVIEKVKSSHLEPQSCFNNSHGF